MAGMPRSEGSANPEQMPWPFRKTRRGPASRLVPAGAMSAHCIYPAQEDKGRRYEWNFSLASAQDIGPVNGSCSTWEIDFRPQLAM